MTAVKIPLGVLTAPSTDITKEPALDNSGGVISIRYEFDRDEIIYSGGVQFQKVRAYKFRAEGHCTAWHIDGAYDTIAVIEGSEWVEDLTSAQSKEWKGYFEMHHYMLYIDGSGCYEIVAASWSLLPDLQKN